MFPENATDEDTIGTNFEGLVKEMKRMDRASGYFMKHILSHLLYHGNDEVRRHIVHVLFDGKDDMNLTTASKAHFVEYQQEHLERKLVRLGILLRGVHSNTNDQVMYRGELYGSHGIQRVLCHAPAPSSFDNILDSSKPGDTLLRNIDILKTLTTSEQTKEHFINLLMYSTSDPPIFYVSSHDWQAPTLSKVLLSDLQKGQPRISLQQKLDISLEMIEGTIRANELHILLRSFSAESFLVKTQQDKLSVIFWDIDSARRGKSDAIHGLHCIGQYDYLGGLSHWIEMFDLLFIKLIRYWL